MYNISSIVTRDYLEDALSESIILIMFEKMNGDRRLMLCTASPEFIPLNDFPTEWAENSGNTFTVYDLEKEAWRKFKFDRMEAVYI